MINFLGYSAVRKGLIKTHVQHVFSTCLTHAGLKNILVFNTRKAINRNMCLTHVFSTCLNCLLDQGLYSIYQLSSVKFNNFLFETQWTIYVGLMLFSIK